LSWVWEVIGPVLVDSALEGLLDHASDKNSTTDDEDPQRRPEHHVLQLREGLVTKNRNQNARAQTTEQHPKEDLREYSELKINSSKRSALPAAGTANPIPGRAFPHIRQVPPHWFRLD